MTSTKFSALRSRAEEIAAQKKALADAEKAHEKALDDAVKHAGRTRAEFVERLYDFFEIEPLTTERRDKNGDVVRDKDGRPVAVKTDRNEAVRILKLAEAFARLVDGEDHLEETEESSVDAVPDDDLDDPTPSAPTPESPVSYKHSYGEDAA